MVPMHWFATISVSPDGLADGAPACESQQKRLCCSIEFRPNDLALPRTARLTDDILQISTKPGRVTAAYLHT